jgi:hypothetical protein
MNPELDEARRRLTRQALSATTLSEIAAAEKALHDWIAAHPEEREFMRDAFEQLSLMQDIAEEQKAERTQKAQTRS